MKEYKSPPKFPLLLLKWFCNPAFHRDIEGDLLEMYKRRLQQHGYKHARWKLLKDVILLFRPGIIRSFINTQKLNLLGMFKHNFIVAMRNFLRYKTSFIINLIGLSTGIMSAIFIYLWVNDEMKTDRFHENSDYLYRVQANFDNNGTINTWDGMPSPLPAAVKEEIPGIKYAIGATDPSWQMKFDLSIEGSHISGTGKFVGKDYFEAFSYPITEGTSESALKELNAIVISEDIALKMFGKKSGIVGKTISWKFGQLESPAIISAVFKSVPKNSTDQFDFVLPFELYQKVFGQSWANPNSVAYVMLEDHADYNEINQQIAGMIKKNDPNSNATLFLQPYADTYLNGKFENGKVAGGRIELVRLFLLIAGFILLIACINFMNLATARASRRMKEVGVKKVVGASRRSLVFQFLSESLLMILFSVLVALVGVYLLLPFFNNLIGKEIQFQIDLRFVLSVLGFVIGLGLLAGSYPAFYLSGFRPISVLKNKLVGTISEFWIRKGLVAFQFTLSIILIISVLFVYQQVEYIQNKPLGYDKENLILFERQGNANEDLTSFINELKQVPGVLNASAITNDILNPPGVRGFTWPGSDDQSIDIKRFLVDYDFIETMGLELVKGRSFARDFSEANPQIVLNQKAVEMMGLDDPIGQTVRVSGNESKVVGVIKDFHHQSLHEEVGPMFFDLQRDFLSTIVVRISETSRNETLSRLEDFYQEYNAGYSFDYTFLTQRHSKLYESEFRISVIARYFAGIGILISVLGLFGLMAFTVERRTKEIGIRKILGANVGSMVALLSKEITWIVVCAIVIAVPISFFFINNWLSEFAYAIEISWLVFVLAGVGSLLLAWLTIGLQIFKTVRINPSTCLRNE